jgi:hypothetical protein
MKMKNIVVYYNKIYGFYQEPSIYYTPIWFIKKYWLKKFINIYFKKNNVKIKTITSDTFTIWVFYAKATHKQNKKFI